MRHVALCLAASFMAVACGSSDAPRDSAGSGGSTGDVFPTTGGNAPAFGGEAGGIGTGGSRGPDTGGGLEDASRSTDGPARDAAQDDTIRSFDATARDITGEDPAIESGNEPPPVSVRVMTLNVYGWATMPASAPTYAKLVEDQGVEVLGIQEGVEDWLVKGLPNDYSKAVALGNALGACWKRGYQIFVNSCKGLDLLSDARFDLTDGPHAARTGEVAVVSKAGQKFAFIVVHWDHESESSRRAEAAETAGAASAQGPVPTIVVGDFNTACSGAETGSMASLAGLTLVAKAEIDCVFARGATGSGRVVGAAPSDHPGVVADLTF